MLKTLVTASVMLFGILSNQAIAGCVAEGFNDPDNFREGSAAMVRNLLNGKSVNATAPGGENWKEDHCSTTGTNPGNLYKVGDGTTVDPRALRGTWQPVDTNGAAAGGWRVKYTYAGGQTYTWRVFRNRNNNNDGVRICWEDEAGKTIAVSLPTTAAGAPCP